MPDIKTYNEGGEEKLYKWVIGEAKPAPTAPTAKPALARLRASRNGKQWANLYANASAA
jgi:hypothetical protein